MALLPGSRLGRYPGYLQTECRAVQDPPSQGFVDFRAARQRTGGEAPPHWGALASVPRKCGGFADEALATLEVKYYVK